MKIYSIKTNIKKTILKSFGIIAVFTLIGFSVTACKEDDHALTGKVSIEITGAGQDSGQPLNVMEGQTLAANTDKLGGSGKINYQWCLDGKNIDKANDKEYTVQSIDIGSVITVKVKRSGYTGSVTSGSVYTAYPLLTGTVSIEGIPQVGRTITANTEELGGSGDISYQWRGDGESVNADSGSYLLKDEDAGKIFTVRVTRAKNSGEVVSDPTIAIYPPGPLPLTGTVTIVGTAMVDETLTANTEKLGGLGDFSYQWMSGANDIVGAEDETYTVRQEDVGSVITVKVTRSESSGETTSDPTAIVILAALTGTVTIEGIAALDQILTANIEKLGGSGDISYQWRIGANNIMVNGTNKTYTLVAGTLNNAISVRVTRTGNSGNVTSDPTPVIVRSVTGITGVPDSVYARRQPALTGSVMPQTATNRTITWSVQSAGTAGASISGNILTTTGEGSITVRATVANGTAVGIDFYQDIPISVDPPPALDQFVKRVTFTGNTETVTFNNLKNHDIYLVKINTLDWYLDASETGSVVLATAPEPAVPAPQFNLKQEELLPVSGVPPISKKLLSNPSLMQPRQSDKPLFNFVQPVVGDKRNYVLGTSYGDADTVLLATGKHGNVWVANNTINTAQAQALAAKFDIIYPASTNIFGYEFGGRPDHPTPGGEDGDMKIQIIVYHIMTNNDDEYNTTSNTVGYFWSMDPNRGELFYMNSHYVINKPNMAYDIMAHEFQHMIHYNVKHLEKPGLGYPDVWFNEMMSMMSQDLISDLIPVLTTDPDHIMNSRMPYFLTDYATQSITMWDQSKNISYSSKYMFGAYLTRNYGGAEFVKRLAENDFKSIDSIDNALPGSVTYKEALIRFGEALVFNDVTKMPEGAHTYNKTITQTINGITYTAMPIDIWNMKQVNPSATGPQVYNLSQRDMPANSVALHQSNDWKNKTGSYSITLQRPTNSALELVLIAKEK